MVLYKFKEPKNVEVKSKTEPKTISHSEDSKSSSYHYDYMKQLMNQKNETKSTKTIETSKKKKSKNRLYDLKKIKPFIIVSVTIVSIIIAVSLCCMIIAQVEVEQTSTSESHSSESYSNVVSEYSKFEGMQENGLPKKWIATVNKDHKYIDFRDLVKEYKDRGVTKSLNFTVTEGNECIVEPIYDCDVQTSWPAYDLCKDSSTKTYNLIVHVQDFSDEIGTVQLVLTVEK